MISTNNNLESKINYLEKRIKDLESKNKKLESKNNNLELNAYSMQSNINSLESKISSINSENIYLKKEIENLKNNLNLINEYINAQKENKRKKYLNFGDSLIVKESEINMICDWIKPDVKIKTKLLYKVSRDGLDKFHKYCDNKGPTIIFVKSSNGYRFGGYTGISWASEFYHLWQGVNDKNSFLFSLNNKLKIMNNNGKSYVFPGIEDGPAFGNVGGGELVINYFNKSHYSTGIDNFQTFQNFCNDSGIAFTFKNKDLIGVNIKGIYYFDVEDFEVYSIKY